MEPNYKVLENNYLKVFDVHLQEFYKRIICKEIDFRNHVEEIKKNLKEIILHYKKENTEKLAVDLRFSTPVRRCAYILKNSPLFASTVAFHFSKMVQENPKVLKKPFERRRLNLCCLGGGPIPEVVGIAKVLGPLYLSTGKQEPLDLKVTIVDIEVGWKTTCGYVLECLKEDKTFEGMDKINVDFNFVQADLRKPTIDEKNMIERADIVTMVFFLSTINGGKFTEESYQMVINILEVIKKDGVLFFLNNATDVHFQQMDKAVKEMGDMEIIYYPCVETLHCLTLKSTEKFLEIYERYFNLHQCMTHGFMSYCVWRKRNEIAELGEAEEKEMEQNLKSQKNNAVLTDEMEYYREELRGLIYKGTTYNKGSLKQTVDTSRPGHKGDAKKVIKSENKNWREPSYKNSVSVEKKRISFTGYSREEGVTEGKESLKLRDSRTQDIANRTNSKSERNEDKRYEDKSRESVNREPVIKWESTEVNRMKESNSENNGYRHESPSHPEVNHKSNEGYNDLTDEQKMKKRTEKNGSETVENKDISKSLDPETSHHVENSEVLKKEGLDTVSGKTEVVVKMPWIPEVELRRPMACSIDSGLDHKPCKSQTSGEDQSNTTFPKAPLVTLYKPRALKKRVKT